MTAETLEEAIGIVNAVDYGLTSGLHSLDREEIDVWLRGVRAGNLYVNRGITGAIVRRQPFGGWKRSVVGPTTKAGGPHYLHGLVDWEDTPTWLTSPESSSTDTDDGQAGGIDPSWLHTAQKLDEKAWTSTFGVDHDISALRAERNILRHVPTGVLVRWESGPAEHLLRVVSAGLRASAPMTVSINPVSSTEQEGHAPISPEGVRGQVDQLRREFQAPDGTMAHIDVHIEDLSLIHI